MNVHLHVQKMYMFLPMSKYANPDFLKDDLIYSDTVKPVQTKP